MVEIVDDRGDISVTYKSWKAYAKALQREVTTCFKAATKGVRKHG